MASASFGQVFDDISRHADLADLSQLLDWLDEIARQLTTDGSRYSSHNAFHSSALAELRGELYRLEQSPVGEYLRLKLAKTLRGLAETRSLAETEFTVVSSSFVLSTLVDMLQNPEQPFEITALLYESQGMFEDWYDHLLVMIGLVSYA